MDLAEIRERMRSVPFGNSQFQALTFHEATTPHREARHLLLQLNQKLTALDAARFRRLRLLVDLEEIEEKLNSSSGFERRRLEIDLEEKRLQSDNEDKFIEDAIIEVASYSKRLEQLPKFTREEFEAAERGYWKARLLASMDRELVGSGTVAVGTVEALNQLGVSVARTEQGRIAYRDALALDGPPAKEGA
jgi:hypothetical protein